MRGTTKRQRTDVPLAVAALGPILVGGVAPAPGLATDLLGLLALDVARWWPADLVVQSLWPGADPVAGARRLRTLVSRVRALPALGAAAATIDGSQTGYRLVVDADMVDVERFRTDVVSGLAALERGAAAEAARTLGRALALWRSTPAATIPDDAGIRPEVQSLVDLRRAALIGWCRAVLAAGDPVAALPALAAATVEHSGHPEPWVLLAQGLAQVGRPADALAILDRGRLALREVSGLDAGETFAEVERGLLGSGPTSGPTTPSGVDVDGRAEPGVPAAGWAVARDLLRRAVAGERHLLVIDAPAGSGATSLLDAMVRAAGPWMRLEDHTGDERREVPSDAAGDEADATAADTAGDPRDDEAAEGGGDAGPIASPTLAILDAAPPPTWRPSATRGLLVVLVRRSPLRADDQDVEQARAAIGSVATSRVRLGPLDEPEIRDLVLAELAGSERTPDPDQVARIVAASGGIVGAARAIAQSSTTGATAALPPDVIDLVERRASGLSRSVRAAIGRLVRGGDFSLGDLQGETGLRERAVIEVLERTERDGLLRVTADHRRFEPVAPVVRAVLVAGPRRGDA